MAVSVFFGKTGSGKSYRADKESRSYDRVFIFDNAHCFKGDFVVTDLSARGLTKLFARIACLKKFRVVFRPDLKRLPKDSCEIVSQFIFAHYGPFAQKYLKDKALFLVDEADKVSSDKKDSWLYKMVTMGRHIGFDSYGISQGPGRLPKYWRENASSVYSFKVAEHDFLRMIFGSHSYDIPTLKEYDYLFWSDTGEITRYDKAARATLLEGA
jgi:hypothetical protein